MSFFFFFMEKHWSVIAREQRNVAVTAQQLQHSAIKECWTWWNCRAQVRSLLQQTPRGFGEVLDRAAPSLGRWSCTGRVQCWLISTRSAHWNHSSLPQISKSHPNIRWISHYCVYNIPQKSKIKTKLVMTNSEIFYTKLVLNQNQNKR